MCIRDRYQRRVRGSRSMEMLALILTIVVLFAGLGYTAQKLGWINLFGSSDEDEECFDQQKFREMSKPPTAQECDNYGGTTDRYVWMQTDDEVEIRFNVKDGVKTKDVDWSLRSDHIKLVVQGQKMVEGKLFKTVVVDDSIWTFDTSDDGKKVLVWTLQKKEKTEGRSHWKYIAEGEPSIDTSRFGSAVSTVDANDPESIKKMVAQMSA
eukprot:TRINITY_DN18403_c0_g1_i2.p1 TRINITY_DN18403_c0_g1~~TRINITY_DN18403_c0_g1_i2.p1  ORF type:complete len:209 (-),score=69.35 TRINITY_DN18403_c0_g1_i2:153-779(-)